MSNKSDELTTLRAENARLIELLEAHGIEWRSKPASSTPANQTLGAPNLPTAEKVALFRHLFRGRTDVYPVRWESATTGKSGYAPACANEWRPGICEKPHIKCADCGNRALIPLSDMVVYSHLAGEKTIGVYPLLPDDTCYFLAVDFDKAEWRDDAQAFVQSCRELDVPVALEISRSGNGAHAWIFFTTALRARDARSLGTAIISHACSRTRQLSLTSYDRLFPNQDTMPKGGFGNLGRSCASMRSRHLCILHIVACPCRRSPAKPATAFSSMTTWACIPINGPTWPHCCPTYANLSENAV